jgi:NTP pyrophosphatase (non-canonical NTP hydrolase)
MNLNQLMDAAHQTARSKGWWDATPEQPERTFGDQIALMHSELSEALEEFRKWGLRADIYYGDPISGPHPNKKPPHKPEGIAIEFADVLIRIFDTCRRYDIPLEEALLVKMQFNETRPHKHGGKII